MSGAGCDIDLVPAICISPEPQDLLLLAKQNANICIRQIFVMSLPTILHQV